MEAQSAVPCRLTTSPTVRGGGCCRTMCPGYPPSTQASPLGSEIPQLDPDTRRLRSVLSNNNRIRKGVRELHCCSPMFWRSIFRNGDSGKNASPPIHLRVGLAYYLIPNV